MKIQTFKRIIKEDVKPEYRELVDKIGFSINVFAEEVVKALNNGLDVEDNFNQAIKDVLVTVDASGVPTSTTAFKSGVTGSIAGLHVIKATNNTSTNTLPTAYPYISWTESNGLITINKIIGLPAKNQFTLRLLIIS